MGYYWWFVFLIMGMVGGVVKVWECNFKCWYECCLEMLCIKV